LCQFWRTETHLSFELHGRNMGYEEQYPRPIRKENRTSSPAEDISSLIDIRGQSRELTDERGSSVSEHECHDDSSQFEMTSTLSTATSSIIPCVSINYNANIQFDPTTQQASKPTMMLPTGY
jgi:hypothetical protein